MKMYFYKKWLTVLLIAFVAPLSLNAVAQEIDPATPTVLDAEGNLLATAILFQLGDVVSIDIKNEGLPEGEYGVHIHETGICEEPDFTRAGGHFNPHGTEHGIDANDPSKGHAGDLPNMIVDANGSGSIQWVTDQLTLAPGEGASLFDADGSAIIIHANADDMTSQPSGNSGPRIGCGVIAAPQDSSPSQAEQPTSTNSAGISGFGAMEIILSLMALAVIALIISRVL